MHQLKSSAYGAENTATKQEVHRRSTSNDRCHKLIVILLKIVMANNNNEGSYNFDEHENMEKTMHPLIVLAVQDEI